MSYGTTSFCILLQAASEVVDSVSPAPSIWFKTKNDVFSLDEQ
jgi:hypothetical protein